MRLLRPSPEVNTLILGVMGRALSLFDVTLHDFIWLSTHWHLLATFADGEQMRGFMNHVQSNVAREVGRENDWRQRFWGRRYRPIPILDEGAQEKRLRYLYSNAVKEFLVPSPEAWPGVSSLPAHLHGASLEGKWIDRTALFHARRKDGLAQSPVSKFTTRYSVPVRPLPFLQRLSQTERRDYYSRICREINVTYTEKARREKRRFLGVAAILAAEPHEAPKNVNRSPAPLCHATAKAIRAAYRRCYTAFRDVYLNLSKRYRSGELGAFESMPAWCFPPPLAFRHEGRTFGLDDLPAEHPPPA